VLCAPRAQWSEHFRELAEAGRAFAVARPHATGELWGATERRADIEAIVPGARFTPDHALPAALAASSQRPAADEVQVALIQGHLDVCGPLAVEELCARSGLAAGAVSSALEALRARGFAISGHFEEGRAEQWCARRLLTRIHSYTRDRRRAQVRPVTKERWLAFLARWWHSAPAVRLHGRAGLAEVIEQLQGFEWPAGDWERLFAERVEAYRPEWLDDLCFSGEVVWGRLSLVEPAADASDPAAGEPHRSGKTPSRRTPITFMLRADMPWLLQAHRGGAVPAEPTAGSGREVLDALRAHGAQFHSELQAITHRLPTEIEEGLWDGVARGLIAADGFNAVRSLLVARTRFARRQRPGPRPGSRGRRGSWRQGVEGRWTLLPAAQPVADADELAEAVAWQLLLRWGVVFRDVYLKERLAVPWREVLWALRRLEARGLIRGGHFVTGITGEQFADERACSLLRGRSAA
jgi:ATP-dependent Lhr-like helicase